MMKILLLFCGVLLVACSGEASTHGEILEKTVAKMDSDTPIYWLEVNYFEWEKTVLVFGYGDNRSACDTIRRVAEAEESGNVQYRCTRS